MIKMIKTCLSLFLITLLVFSFMSCSSAIIVTDVTIHNWDTGSNKIADYGLVKCVRTLNDPDSGIAVNKGETESKLVSGLKSIEFTGNSNGYNAYIEHIDNIINTIMSKYNDRASDFKILATGNFYKPGKCYYNKVRDVTIKWTVDNQEYYITTGPIDQKTIDLNDYRRLI